MVTFCGVPVFLMSFVGNLRRRIHRPVRSGQADTAEAGQAVDTRATGLPESQ